MATAKRDRKGGDAKRVRWAVVGLGYFAQAAVLPTFAHARQTCELVALFRTTRARDGAWASNTASAGAALRGLRRYLASGEVDAVYIALPNDLHRGVHGAAARAGSTCCARSRWRVTGDECLRDDRRVPGAQASS